MATDINAILRNGSSRSLSAQHPLDAPSVRERGVLRRGVRRRQWCRRENVVLVMRHWGRRESSVVDDEDALARALLGGLNGGVFVLRSNGSHAFLSARSVLDVGAFFDVGQTVVEQGEDGGSDLLAESIAGAEILIDPDLHRNAFLTHPPPGERLHGQCRTCGPPQSLYCAGTSLRRDHRAMVGVTSAR